MCRASCCDTRSRCFAVPDCVGLEADVQMTAGNDHRATSRLSLQSGSERRAIDFQISWVGGIILTATRTWMVVHGVWDVLCMTLAALMVYSP
jgi:hypothetical protein